MIRVALLAVVAALAVPASAQANWELAPDGNPKITINDFMPGDLFVCSPGSSCEGINPPPADAYLPGDTAPGTVFEFRDGDKVQRSPAWQGRVTNTAPPTVGGALHAIGHATPVAGTWTGGWGNDLSAFNLSACLTPAGGDCVALPAIQGCPHPCLNNPERHSTWVSIGGQAAIPPGLAGRFLIATEWRLPRDQRGWPVPVPALWDPAISYALDPETALVRRSVPIGPLGIPAPVVQPEPEPKVAPTVTLRAKALRRNGRIHVGRVTCADKCTVAVRVSGGGRKAYLRTFTARGTQAITAPARRGKLAVRVRVDGQLLAKGRVSAR